MKGIDSILKITGILFVICGMSYLGFYKVFIMNEQIRHIKTFKESLIVIRGYIGYAIMSIPEIFEVVAETIDDKNISGCYISAAMHMKKRQTDNFRTIWKNAISENIDNNYIGKKQTLIIEKIGHMPVHLDTDMQIKVIDGVVMELEGAIDNVTEELKQKERVYKCGGVMAGIFIVIILL